MRKFILLPLAIVSTFICCAAGAEDRTVALLPSCETIPRLLGELRYTLSSRTMSVVEHSVAAAGSKVGNMDGCALAAQLDADFGVWLSLGDEAGAMISVCHVETMKTHVAPLPASAGEASAETAAIVIVSLLDETDEDLGTAASPQTKGTEASIAETADMDHEKPWTSVTVSSASPMTLRRLHPAISLVGLGLTLGFSTAAVVFSFAMEGEEVSTIVGEEEHITFKGGLHPAFFYAAVASAAVFGTATTIIGIGFTDWSFGKRRRARSNSSVGRLALTITVGF